MRPSLWDGVILNFEGSILYPLPRLREQCLMVLKLNFDPLP